MPDYQFTDPKTGLTLSVSGPEPPPQGVLAQMFADAAKKAPKTEAPAEKPHPEATIGPSPDDAPVTLGDLIENPSGALKRMVAITQKGLSDPRNTIPAAIGLAAGATGLMPRSFASTRGMASPPPAAPSAPPAPRTGLGQALRENVSLDDVAGMMPGPIRSGYRVAKGIAQAVTQRGQAEPAAPAPAPVATAPASAPIEVAPPTPKASAPAPTPTPKTAAPKAAPKSAARAKAAKAAPAEDVGDLPSLDELQLTPAEITTAVKWHEAGVSPETILHRIIQSRQLTARTRTDTPDQAAAAVKQRNETGKWGDEGYVK